MFKLKIKKGDRVLVITGKDKGKNGQVVTILPKINKAIVSGVNLVKKHQKPTKESDGGIIFKEMPIHLSNISIIDPKLNKPTKIGYRIQDDGKKIRFAKASNEPIDNKGKK